MKKLLLAAGLLIALTSGYAPTASAGGSLNPPDFTIDCSADTDPTEDNTNEYWADYSGGTVTVLTINCMYSCAFGSTDQNTSCGSAHLDASAARIFTVSGPAMIHAYSPGSYGEEVFFGTTAEELNFQATVNEDSIEFTWNEIPNAGAYYISKIVNGGDMIVCTAFGGATSCLADEPIPKTAKTYFMSVYFEYTEAFKTQNEVASVEVVAAATTTTTAQETLAATGGESGRQVIVVLALIAMGVAALSLMRRRTI